MAFQAYPDHIETKTGLTPRQFIDLAHERGYDQPDARTGAHRDASSTLWLDGKPTKPLTPPDLTRGGPRAGTHHPG